MPAKSDPAFQPLADITTPVWRYMNFTKFVAMLETRCLYFSRADCLGDPYEGSMPQTFRRERVAYASWLTNQPSSPGSIKQSVGYDEKFRKDVRRAVYINCWHANEHESAAMWKLYGTSTEAVAIQSTYQLLHDLLPADVILGRVDYIDFLDGKVPSDMPLAPFAYKRKSFEHEREIRAVIADVERFDDIRKNGVGDPEVGIEKRIELHVLIQRVFVAPSAPNWFKSLVEALCAKYSLSVPVKMSAMDERPLFWFCRKHARALPQGAARVVSSPEQCDVRSAPHKESQGWGCT